MRPKDSGEAELVGSFPKEERGEEKNVTHCMTRSDWGYDGELCVDTAKLLGRPIFSLMLSNTKSSRVKV